MKITFLLGSFLLLTLACPAAIPKRSTFAIYLTASSVECRMFAQEPGRWKELPLAAQPVISEDDIIAYDFSKHAMKLTAEAIKRLPHPSVTGTGFVLLINGERIYPGAFYTMVSSIPCDLPVIIVDRKSQNRSSRTDVLLIEISYPAHMAHGKDLRSDVRVRDALADLKKLASL